MSDVNANGRSVLHEGDGLTQVSGPPDVCKTPAPGGPVPLPYPNAAMDKHLAKGTKQVKINGHPAAIASSNLSTSTGDEPGTAGGLISSKTKGKLTFASSSIDVSFETGPTRERAGQLSHASHASSVPGARPPERPAPLPLTSRAYSFSTAPLVIHVSTSAISASLSVPSPVSGLKGMGLPTISSAPVSLRKR